MVYLRGDNLSSNFLYLEPAPARAHASLALTQKLEKGGVAQITSLRGGSKTWFALSCLGLFLESYHGDPPLSLWVSDDGLLYPESLYHLWNIPLSRLLLVSVGHVPHHQDGHQEIWKVVLESIQTGLFLWILIRTSSSCHPSYLRKIQIEAERAQCRVLLLGSQKMPHWILKAKVEVDANLVSSKRSLPDFVQ
jgi:hypothetical protein